MPESARNLFRVYQQKLLLLEDDNALLPPPSFNQYHWPELILIACASLLTLVSITLLFTFFTNPLAAGILGLITLGCAATGGLGLLTGVGWLIGKSCATPTTFFAAKQWQQRFQVQLESIELTKTKDYLITAMQTPDWQDLQASGQRVQVTSDYFSSDPSWDI